MKKQDLRGLDPLSTPSKSEVKALEKQVEELLERRKAEKASTFAQFGRRYFDDPAGFVKECIHWTKDEGVTPYQEEMLCAIPAHSRVAVVGPHGLGKSSSCSWLILWFVLTREALKLEYKCVCTASVSTQLVRYLWPEVKMWARLLNWNKIGREPFSMRTELLSSAIQLKYGQAFCVSPEEPGRLEGAHSDNLLYCIDESKIVPDGIWDAIEGAFSGAGTDTKNRAYCYAISTPGPPLGRFYAIHARKPGFERWWCRHVKIEEVIAAGRVSQEWVEEKKRQWGPSSSVYKQKVEGLFASDDESSLIPFEWIQRAIERGEAGAVPAV